MKRYFKIVACVGVVLLILTGCNYQVADFKYQFNYAYCNYDYLPEEIRIVKWKDYEDGEQLQITDENNNTLLVSSYNCTLSKEKIENKEEK